MHFITFLSIKAPQMIATVLNNTKSSVEIFQTHATWVILNYAVVQKFIKGKLLEKKTKKKIIFYQIDL